LLAVLDFSFDVSIVFGMIEGKFFGDFGELSE